MANRNNQANHSTLFFFLILLFPFSLFAQPDSSHLRVSLLTISPGEQIYASFGHTGVRITDTANGKDIVFNYGTFDFNDKDFEMKFARGKLLYSISSSSFQEFYGQYIYEKRTVQEQELFLNGEQKIALYDFLIQNEKPANRYYKYDFLFDNCATRIRDIFPKTFGKEFKFGQTIPTDSKMTFRHIINYYLRGIHWERFGINILLGSPVDRVMTNEEIMFLPDYLRDGIGDASVKGEKIATAPVTILSMPPIPEPGLNVPMVAMLCVCLLTIIGLCVPQLKSLGTIMSTIVMVITGLLGLLILFMWLGTDHQSCRGNWNILWALPTNIVFPFFSKRGRDKYAIIAILLIFISLILHVLHIQELPLLELGPLLVAMLFIYGMIYRRQKSKGQVYGNTTTTA